MKTEADIEQDLDRLIQEQYYSEGSELLAAVRQYGEALGAAEQAALRSAIGRRLAREPTELGVLLVSCWPTPEAAPRLVRLLDRESVTSRLTRTIMKVLPALDPKSAYRAIERFLDSEQDGEALMQLARLDFPRTAAALRRALRNDRLLDVCLHILHDRKKAVGLPALVEELKGWLTPAEADEVRLRLGRALRAKPGPYNPFAPEEVDAIRFALHIA
jgi:hypothetical protein